MCLQAIEYAQKQCEKEGYLKGDENFRRYFPEYVAAFNEQRRQEMEDKFAAIESANHARRMEAERARQMEIERALRDRLGAIHDLQTVPSNIATTLKTPVSLRSAEVPVQVSEANGDLMQPILEYSSELKDIRTEVISPLVEPVSSLVHELPSENIHALSAEDSRKSSEKSTQIHQEPLCESFQVISEKLPPLGQGLEPPEGGSQQHEAEKVANALSCKMSKWSTDCAANAISSKGHRGQKRASLSNKARGKPPTGNSCLKHNLSSQRHHHMKMIHRSRFKRTHQCDKVMIKWPLSKQRHDHRRVPNYRTCHLDKSVVKRPLSSQRNDHRKLCKIKKDKETPVHYTTLVSINDFNQLLQQPDSYAPVSNANSEFRCLDTAKTSARFFSPPMGVLRWAPSYIIFAFQDVIITTLYGYIFLLP